MKQSNYNIWVEYQEGMYVFNGLSGNLLRISKEQYYSLQSFISGNKNHDCSPKVINELVIGRMLVSDISDEVKLLNVRYKSSRNDMSSFGLTVITSLGCNFNCPYCFEAKHPSIMGDKVQNAVLQILDDQLKNINNFNVSWFGGEPLVGKKSLLALSDAFIERCNRHNVAYTASITTNGYLLDLKTCVQLRERKVHTAQICLDGPPDIHDKMRPLAGGKGTFWEIVENIKHAIDYFNISIRINVNSNNLRRAEELLQILAEQGLSNKLSVYIGQLVQIDDGVSSPSATYKNCCFTNSEFAYAELEFQKLASEYGFSAPFLPRPTGTPCTAVRKNEIVVGSEGELYKCWESVGNKFEVIGHVFDYQNLDGRLQKWLKYNPFTNDECRSCIALPVCMGGCAHHAMDIAQYENRCGTFRHTYQEQVIEYVKFAEQKGYEGLITSRHLASQMETR